MERLFLAVPLTEPARAALRDRLATAFPRGVPGRAVPPDGWHLTLRFLGDTPAERAARVVAEMEAAPPAPAFSLALGGWGAFPKPGRASVFWAGVRAGTPALERLAATAEAAAVAAGFAPEPRPFSPHLTLSRLRPPQDLTPVLRAAADFRIEIPVTGTVLYRSQLGGGPARYEVVRRFPLS